MQDLLDQVVYYVDALWRRRWIALGIAVLIACGGWAFVATMSNKYESTAQIYVDTASVLNPLLRGVTVDNNVQHQVAVMRQTLVTRPNLEEVVRRTDMDLEAKTPAEFEGLLQSVRNRIRISSNRTNIFTIKFTDTDPRRAHDVVQTLTTMFVQQNLGQNRRDMETAQTFLKRQIRHYEAQLNAAESRLANYKQEHRELLPGQSGLQDELAGAQTRLQELRAQLSDGENRLQYLRQELENTPEMLTQQGAGYGSGPPTNTEARIMELRARLDRLSSRYTEQHPDVKAAQRELQGLMQEFEAQQEARQSAVGPDGEGADAAAPEGGIQVPNPTYSELRLAFIEQQSDVQSLRGKVSRARENVAAIEKKLARVPEVEARLKQLTRDYGIIKSQYETLLQRRESAQISADREQQSDKVQFRIIEPPQVPVTPAGPNRPMFMAAVLVMSLGAGVGSTGLLALTKATYGSVNHLRRDFDLPLIGAVSRLPSRYEKIRAIAEGLGLTLAIAAFVGLFGLLVLVERQVGLPTLLDGPMTPDRILGVLQTTVQGMTGGSGAG